MRAFKKRYLLGYKLCHIANGPMIYKRLWTRWGAMSWVEHYGWVIHRGGLTDVVLWDLKTGSYYRHPGFRQTDFDPSEFRLSEWR